MRTSIAVAVLALVPCCRAAEEEDPGPAAPGTAAAAGRRPNIVFVFTDDHASHAIGAYGSIYEGVTPNIDRLAESGMLFTNNFCGNSICGPSRATVLTGLHSNRNGFIDNASRFDGSQTTFPKLLQGAGYQTVMLGKWHLVSDPTGFDHWEILPGQGHYYGPDFKTPEGTHRREGYVTDIITDLALDWLREERDPQRPFLLMVQHKAPHRAWMPGPEHHAMFEGQDLPEPPTLFDDWAGRATAAAENEMSVADHLWPYYDLKLEPLPDEELSGPDRWARGRLDRMTPEHSAAWVAAYGPRNAAFRASPPEGDDLVRWKYQRYMKDYLRCVSAVDDGVGELLEELDALGLAEDTVVVYSSDQGFYLGDHGWYDKRWMYEESFRMPLIVSWPGVVPAAVREARLTQNIDFAPTFLDLAGVEVPDPMQGESLKPLLFGEPPPDWRDSIYYHYYEYPQPHRVARHYGVRTDRYKLIHYYERDEWELFDLAVDPHELRSLHDDYLYAEIRLELERELARLQEQYGDTNPSDPVAGFRREQARAKAASVPRTDVLQVEALPASFDAPGDPSAKPLAVAARVLLEGPNGVVMSHGGESYGYSLYLFEGVPRFAVRDGDELFEVAAPEAVPLGRPVHLAATLAADGVLALYVDGSPVATAPGELVGREPNDGFTVGYDDDSAVGAYTPPNRLAGEVSELRLCFGPVQAEEIAGWARPSESR